MAKVQEMGVTSVSVANQFLQKMKFGEIFEGQKIREIYRRQWRKLSTKDAVNEVIDLLEDHAYLRRRKVVSFGGTSEIIEINPAFEGGAL